MSYQHATPFAALSKKAFAALGGSVGAQYGQTIAAPALPTGMPSAGTPVTAGMATDERMHAQNKLNASAGGAVAAQKAPSSVRPTVEQLTAFRKGTTTKFNPDSDLDRRKMDALIAGNQGWAANQGARGAMAIAKATGGAAMQSNSTGRIGHVVPPAPARAKIVEEQPLLAKAGSAALSKTAFAMLEKGAGSPASFIANIARKGGGALRRAGAKARINTPHTTKPQNTPDVINLGPSQAAPAASSKSTAIIPHPTANAAPEAMPGDRRMAAGNWLKRLAKKVDDPTVAGRINYGAGTIAGGGALYGAHSMGHNSGRESGVLEGVDQGMELGLQGAQAMQPGDPGFLGRLGDLFTGTQAGPDVAAMRQGLNSDRDKLVKAILEG